MQYGDLATWVGSVGTVGTLASGLWLLKRNEDDRRADAQNARKAQARHVSAWAEAGGGSQSGTEADMVWSSHAHLLNNSAEPIYDVLVRVVPWNFPGQRTDQIELWRLPVAVPGKEYQSTGSFRAPPVTWPQQYACTITFRDAAGIVWRRYADSGELIEMSPPLVRPLDERQ